MHVSPGEPPCSPGQLTCFACRWSVLNLPDVRLLIAPLIRQTRIDFGRAEPGTSAMNLLFLLALAIPLSGLALLVSLALTGVMTLGGAMQLIAAVGRLRGNASQSEANRPWSSDYVS
jgi:hypothetical protein